MFVERITLPEYMPHWLFKLSRSIAFFNCLPHIFSFLPLRSSLHYFLFFFIRLFISRPDSPFLTITLNHSLVSHPRCWPWIWKLSTIHPINLATVWAAKKPEGALTLWQRIQLNFWLVPIKIFWIIFSICFCYEDSEHFSSLLSSLFLICDSFLFFKNRCAKYFLDHWAVSGLYSHHH